VSRENHGDPSDGIPKKEKAFVTAG